ncbi:hypothetical protein TUM4438_10140 [Shewanella sairae]|uniref:HTH cro/C1-type domain-containing protein n=1 Tax=Shewanella sairae TaxID=190310 RepID=A0ABQ4P5N2_9GAMM|nr:helix-turn-helix transcriptional regulator [Shewanella sairae]MCL1130448.1 helix-turn-helix domain-containing protein [Shewanella sairae]GIU42782.1 hypothetical protein TUM4438_10140 [Shewanella sairae]
MTPTEKRISDAIKACGLSNTELAKRVNVERTSIGKWIQTGRLSVENLANLCSVLNIDPKYFMYEDENTALYSNVFKNELEDIISTQLLLLEKLEKLKDG